MRSAVEGDTNGPGPASLCRAIPKQVDPGHPEEMADAAGQRSMAVPLTAFAAGAVVALLVGVFGKAHDPSLDATTTLGFDTVIDMKVVLSVVVGVLAVLQLIGALWIYGRLGIAAPSWLGTAHRLTGTSPSPCPCWSPTTVSGRWASRAGAWRVARRCRRGQSSTVSSVAPWSVLWW